MNENEAKLDMLVAELDYENRLLRARNDRLMREAEATNFDRTAAWLKACGKEQLNPAHLSVQIGVHFEEIVELLECIETDCVKHKEKFRARIQIDGHLKHLGLFDTVSDAYAAYIAAKRKLHPACTI